MENPAIDKARTLVEALPYIKKFRGQTIVIKLGGSLMEDSSLKQDFAKDVLLLKYVGLNPVIVHGGGKEISRWMAKIGKEPKFVSGLRYTDQETMELCEMVLTGKINREVVSFINRIGGKAVGISGRDANAFTARKIRGANDEDLGLVGEVETCDISFIKMLSEQGYIPVISSISEDIEGQPLNVNADYAAAGLAAGLKALKLIYLTDVPGLMVEGTLIPEMDLKRAQELKTHPDVQGGMVPKLDCCIKAILEGVKHVHILNGKAEHCLLLEIFTDIGIGSKISYSLREVDAG